MRDYRVFIYDDAGDPLDVVYVSAVSEKDARMEAEIKSTNETVGALDEYNSIVQCLTED